MGLEPIATGNTSATNVSIADFWTSTGEVKFATSESSEQSEIVSNLNESTPNDKLLYITQFCVFTDSNQTPSVKFDSNGDVYRQYVNLKEKNTRLDMGTRTVMNLSDEANTSYPKSISDFIELFVEPENNIEMEIYEQFDLYDPYEEVDDDTITYTIQLNGRILE